jgi:ABC-type Na+ efflux pump permease subunit
VKLFPIVRREYLERIRSKAFIVGTIVGPLLLAALNGNDPAHDRVA